MKKNQVFWILVFFLQSINLAAQENTWQIGFELGSGLRWIQYDETETDNKPALSLATGFTFKYLMTDNLALRSGINFEKKGRKSEITYVDNSGNDLGLGDYFTNLNYIAMPLLFQVTFGKKIKPYFFGGPYGGILVSARSRIFIPDEDVKTADIRDSYKDFDWGIAAGAGVQVPLSEQFSVSGEFRGLIGLYDIMAYDIGLTTSAMTRTSNFMVGFIYKIPAPKDQK